MNKVFLLLASLLAPAVSAGELPTAIAREESRVAEHRLDGVVEAVNRATVSAQTSGRIIELPFDVDDYVEKGEVIVRFRDAEQRARFEQARAALAEARARHTEAEADLKRIREIYQQQLVSRADLDRAQADFTAAQARLEAARAALKAAEEQLEQTVVRAPYSGIVVERHVEVGELATIGKPLMTGVSLEDLRVLVEVPQSLIAGIRERRAAAVILPDDTRLEAASLRIYPYADAATHTFRVRINLPPGQHGVYPGMLVKAVFPGEQRLTLTVPSEAVARRGEVTAVYVQDGQGRLHFRQIRTGRETGGRTEVLAGLVPGERVLTDTVAAAQAWKAQYQGTGE